MEEWQDPDSGYLNCIGVGDSYVKRQMARILNGNYIKTQDVSYYPYEGGVDIWVEKMDFSPKNDGNYGKKVCG